ncbi:DNA sulfur modification protein DndB [Burkholderia multivorans]|nr:DNA sulfur modification protein DndB [Burkholderia multivorans]
MVLLTNTQSALNVHVQGTVGTFRVTKADNEASGIEVKYVLTHVSLSAKQGQTQLLDMLAPVREIFDLKQLDFDEIMQRDIDDARVSLELIPYLLDPSVSGQIKLFPPIVAIALPLQPVSRMPDTLYRKVTQTQAPSEQHKGYDELTITAGEVGAEQFQFRQFVLNNGEVMTTDGAMLSLSRDNCALAIVDGQHRAMALLALHRNLTGGWTDAKRSPYERYYKVWPDKEIRTYDLEHLQMPMIICTFPQLDAEWQKDMDVIRAARRVFLTLNKTAKKVSDSRNRLLNDQDIVAECLRETLSHVKQFGSKDETGLRIFNIELDQEGDRVKVGSDVAFSGVSHLYHLTEHILMSDDIVRGIEAKGKVGAPRKRLHMAYVRLGLKDSIVQAKREANTRTNYSDEIANEFRTKWRELYVPPIERMLSKFHPFAAFSNATLALQQELIGAHDPELEKMLFDGQATARTFDEFREGLERRNKDKEPGWTSPEITETLTRVDGLVTKRKTLVKGMRTNRASHFLSNLSKQALNKVTVDNVLDEAIKDAIDGLFENVFSTVAFQTALICTYTEAIEQALGDITYSTTELLDEYLNNLHNIFAPSSVKELERLFRVFVGDLSVEPAVKVVTGGPVFRNVVLPGELQPAEWPKYRYLLLEMWTPQEPKLKEFVLTDRNTCRAAVAASLFERRFKSYCEENRLTHEEVQKEVRDELLTKVKADFESFLSAVHGKNITLERSIFES